MPDCVFGNYVLTAYVRPPGPGRWALGLSFRGFHRGPAWPIQVRLGPLRMELARFHGFDCCCSDCSTGRKILRSMAEAWQGDDIDDGHEHDAI